MEYNGYLLSGNDPVAEIRRGQVVPLDSTRMPLYLAAGGSFEAWLESRAIDRHRPNSRIVKKVLVMTVNPGNAGQMYMPYVGKKISRLLLLKGEMRFRLYWDGACSADKILKFAPMGMDGFVLGTTLLFGKKRSYKEIMQEIRKCCDDME